MRVRNDRPTRTNPGMKLAAFDPGEVREVPDSVGEALVRIAGFSRVDPVKTPETVAEFSKPVRSKRKRKVKES